MNPFVLFALFYHLDSPHDVSNVKQVISKTSVFGQSYEAPARTIFKQVEKSKHREV